MPRRTPIELHIAQTTDRSLRYEARMRASGLTKVCVWVPASRVDDLKSQAETWREEDAKSRVPDLP
jgi:hypothetical protein